jgi:hypothetical protein
MIRTVCDTCDNAIGRVDGDWFGVDHVRLDDDGELIEPGVDHTYHFCSSDCLATWVLDLAVIGGTNGAVDA